MAVAATLFEVQKEASAEGMMPIDEKKLFVLLPLAETRVKSLAEHLRNPPKPPESVVVDNVDGSLPMPVAVQRFSPELPASLKIQNLEIQPLDIEVDAETLAFDLDVATDGLKPGLLPKGYKRSFSKPRALIAAVGLDLKAPTPYHAYMSGVFENGESLLEKFERQSAVSRARFQVRTNREAGRPDETTFVRDVPIYAQYDATGVQRNRVKTVDETVKFGTDRKGLYPLVPPTGTPEQLFQLASLLRTTFEDSLPKKVAVLENGAPTRLLPHEVAAMVNRFDETLVGEASKRVSTFSNVSEAPDTPLFDQLTEVYRAMFAYKQSLQAVQNPGFFGGDKSKMEAESSAQALEAATKDFFKKALSASIE